uniref:Uncharacterized protein n=1 Tax=Anguilla anguilla TaxID=7936 RepID=A0A0E9QP76_ANGAN
MAELSREKGFLQDGADTSYSFNRKESLLNGHFYRQQSELWAHPRPDSEPLRGHCTHNAPPLLRSKS